MVLAISWTISWLGAVTSWSLSWTPANLTVIDKPARSYCAQAADAQSQINPSCVLLSRRRRSLFI